jgi:hypothetical protein
VVVSHNSILTKDNLSKRKWKGNTSCAFCNETESGPHLFFECPTAKYVWSLLAYSLGSVCRPSNIDRYWLWVQGILPPAPNMHTVGLAAVCWAIWRTRNSVCFENKESNLLLRLFVWSVLSSLTGQVFLRRKWRTRWPRELKLWSRRRSSSTDKIFSHTLRRSISWCRSLDDGLDECCLPAVVSCFWIDPYDGVLYS